jgi:protein disulfide-isomerase-like protein
LTPIWLKAQDYKKEKKLTHLGMAKVECTENAELCAGLDGYPTIQYFKDGKMEQDLDIRDYEPLIQKIEELNGKQVPTSTASETLLKIGEEETRPDPAVNPSGEVVYLTDADFKTETKEQPWIVMFHAPWCGHCKQLAPIYVQLGPRLRNRVNVAKVDCTTQKNTCNEKGIKGYPTIKFIHSDTEIEFSGSRQIEAMEDFALSFVGKPSFELIKSTEIQTAIERSEAAAFFVFDGNDDLVPFSVSIGKMIKNKIKYYICPEKAGYAVLGLTPVPSEPTLVIYTDNGINREKFTGTFADTIPNKWYIKNWILERKNPLVPLLEAHNQAELTDNQHLLITIVDPDSIAGKKAIKDIKLIASEWKKANPSSAIRFCWLDGMKYASYVNQVYGVLVNTLPRVIVTQPRDELYYTNHKDDKQYELNQKSVFQAFEEISQGIAKVIDTYVAKVHQRICRNDSVSCIISNQICLQHDHSLFAVHCNLFGNRRWFRVFLLL